MKIEHPGSPTRAPLSAAIAEVERQESAADALREAVAGASRPKAPIFRPDADAGRVAARAINTRDLERGTTSRLLRVLRQELSTNETMLQSHDLCLKALIEQHAIETARREDTAVAIQTISAHISALEKHEAGVE